VVSTSKLVHGAPNINSKRWKKLKVKNIKLVLNGSVCKEIKKYEYYSQKSDMYLQKKLKIAQTDS